MRTSTRGRCPARSRHWSRNARLSEAGRADAELDFAPDCSGVDVDEHALEVADTPVASCLHLAEPDLDALGVLRPAGGTIAEPAPRACLKLLLDHSAHLVEALGRSRRRSGRAELDCRAARPACGRAFGDLQERVVDFSSAPWRCRRHPAPGRQPGIEHALESLAPTMSRASNRGPRPARTLEIAGHTAPRQQH